MLIASFCFATVGACARFLDTIDPIEKVFFRNLIGLLALMPIIFKNPLQNIGGYFGLLVFRGIIGTLALYAFFYGIKHIGLPLAITYQQSHPLFLLIIGFIIFRENFRYLEISFVIIGFIGIYIFFSMDGLQGVPLKYNLIALSNALMTAAAYASIKTLSKYYDYRTIILTFLICGTVMPIVSLVVGTLYPYTEYDFLIGVFTWPSLHDWPVLFLLGISALAGQYFLTMAFSYGKSGTTAAIGYSNIIFSIAFAVLLGDPFPTFYQLVGILLIILSGIGISWVSKKRQ